MRHFVFYAMLFLCLGCKHEVAGSLEVIEIDVNDDKSISPEAAFRSFSTVTLEVTPNSVLPDVSKVLVANGRIYVLSMMDARVFIFSREGKYINSLTQGQGPGEVLFVSDMDAEDGNLFVLDNYRTVRMYDADGRYLKDVYSSNQPCFSMQYREGNLLLFDPYIDRQSAYLLRVVRNDSVSYLLEKEKRLEKGRFAYYNVFGDGYLSWPLSNTIYHTDGTSVEAVCTVRFHGKNFYDAILDAKLTSEELCDLNQNEHYYRWLKDVYLQNDLMYFAFKYDKNYYVKHRGDSTVIHSTLVEGFPPMKRAAVGHTLTHIIYAYTAEELLSYREWTKEKESSSPHSELLDSIDEDANPMLVFFRISDEF